MSIGFIRLDKDLLKSNSKKNLLSSKTEGPIVASLFGRFKSKDQTFLVKWIALGFLAQFLRPLGLTGTDAYFRVLLLNTFFYLCLIFLQIPFLQRISERRFLKKLFVSQILFLSFPYGMFNLNQFFYYSENSAYYIIPKSEKNIVRDYFLNGIFPSGFPGKFPLFMAIAIFFFIWLKNSEISNKVLLAISFVSIYLTTWRNTSYASPISWSSSREFPIESHRVYLRSHWPDGSGAVSADQPAWAEITRLFQFGEIDNALFIRRPVPNYLVSQISYFTNSYHAWIVLNVSLWMLALISLGYTLKKLNFSQDAQTAGVLILATAPLFKTFVGQSSGYVASFAAVWILIGYVTFIQASAHSKGAKNFYISIAFALGFLTYDLYIWIPIFLVILPILGVMSLKNTFAAAINAFLIFIFYRYFLIPILEINVKSDNENILISTLGSAIDNVKGIKFIELEALLRKSVTDYFGVVWTVATPFVFLLIFALILLLTLNKNSQSYQAKWVSAYTFLFVYPMCIVLVFTISGQSVEGSTPYRYSIVLIPLILLVAQLIDKLPKSSRTTYLLIAIFILFGLLSIQIGNFSAFDWMYHNINIGHYRPMVW